MGKDLNGKELGRGITQRKDGRLKYILNINNWLKKIILNRMK